MFRPCRAQANQLMLMRNNTATGTWTRDMVHSGVKDTSSVTVLTKTIRQEVQLGSGPTNSPNLDKDFVLFKGLV